MSEYQAWLATHGAQHGHCPLLCENPQPFEHEGQLVCGMCAAMDGVVSPMVPCTPDTCHE